MHAVDHTEENVMKNVFCETHAILMCCSHAVIMFRMYYTTGCCKPTSHRMFFFCVTHVILICCSHAVIMFRMY